MRLISCVLSLVPAVALALVACSPVDPNTEGSGGGATSVTSGNTTSTASSGGEGGGGADATGCAKEVLPALAAATGGLVYQSETDSTFQPLSLQSPASGPITPEELLGLLGMPSTTITETRTLEVFFAAPLKGKDAERYQQLYDLLKEKLTYLNVIRLIDGANKAQIHVYIVGRTPCGEVAGISTTAVET